MEGIYYKDGVYVLIDNDEEHEDCVYHNQSKRSVSLYGGRVAIRRVGDEYGIAIITIDGVELVKLINNHRLGKEEVSQRIELSTITQYLNAIEANGVDTFMQHYKESIEFLYNELIKLREKTESEISTSKNDSTREIALSKLSIIKEMLFKTLCALFTLKTFISAGLENEKVISVYQSIMETIA